MRIARMIGIGATPKGGGRPGQQETLLLCVVPPATQAIDDTTPLVFGNRTPDLEEQLVMRSLHRGLIDNVNGTPSARTFFQHHQLMKIIPGKPVRTGNEDALKSGVGCLMAQLLQSWSLEHGATIPVILEDLDRRRWPVLTLILGAKAGDVLIDRLRMDVLRGGHANIHRDAQHAPPVTLQGGWLPMAVPRRTLGTSAHAPPEGGSLFDECASAVDVVPSSTS